MNDGRMKILEMLQEGKITAEEANTLLRQFPEQESQKESAHADEERGYGDGRLGLRGELKEVGGEIWEELKGAGEGLKEAFEEVGEDRSIFGLPSMIHAGIFNKSQPFTFESKEVSQAINSLKLAGKNNSVVIEGYDGDTIKIEGSFDPKLGREPNVFFSEQDGDFEILYDYNAVYSLKISAKVPRVAISHIHAMSKNATIDISDLSASNVVAVTTNSSVKIDDVNCEQLQAETRNAKISVESVTAEHIDLATTNSKIVLDEVVAKEAKLKTTNAAIKLSDLDVKKLFVKTSNGSIKLEDVIKKADPDVADGHSEYTIEAHTTNSRIQICLPKEVGYKIQASTSTGKIASDIEDLHFQERKNSYMSAISQKYEEFKQKAKINLSTTNSSIKIEDSGKLGCGKSCSEESCKEKLDSDNKESDNGEQDSNS